MQKRKIHFCKKNKMWALKLYIPGSDRDSKPLPTEYVPNYKEAKDWLDGNIGNGNCYESAAKMMFSWDKLQNPILCHGIVRGQGDLEGSRFGHAWIEYELELPNTNLIEQNTKSNEAKKAKKTKAVLSYPTTATLLMVIDHSNGKKLEMPQALYYNIGDIKRVKTYNKCQARSKLLKELTYGPWD